MFKSQGNVKIYKEYSLISRNLQPCLKRILKIQIKPTKSNISLTLMAHRQFAGLSNKVERIVKRGISDQNLTDSHN